MVKMLSRTRAPKIIMNFPESDRRSVLDERILSENLKFSKDLNSNNIAGLKDPNKKDLAITNSQQKRYLHVSKLQQKRMYRKKKPI